MCDVTVDNFEEVLARIRAIVPNCDFVSIDLEFTGLDHGDLPKNSKTEEGAEAGAAASECADPGAALPAEKLEAEPFDVKAEAQTKYQKFSEATSFLVVQVGICPFVWNQKKKTFVASPFNFYTFPCEFRGIDRRFVCQTRCMQFLSNSSLDFNKLFKSGVPFLNHQEEEMIRSCGGKDSKFIDATRSSLVDFISQSSEASMLLPPADGYHRMLCYRELTDVFFDVLKHERATAVNGEMCVRVFKTELTASLGDTRAAVEAAVGERARQLDEKQLATAIGFRHVVDLLVAMRKPLVGHNMLLDMMQLEAHFGRELPPHIADFKTSLHGRFPCLIDTKHLLAAAPKSLTQCFPGGSRLDLVFRTVTNDPKFKEPKVELAAGFERYRAQRQHEAGYDAYMTGVAYLRLAKQLMTTVSKSSRSSSPLTAAHTGLTPRLREMGGASLRPNLQMMELLRAHGYCNKLHVVGGSQLVAIDLEADRDGEMIDDEPPLSAGELPDFALHSPKRGRPLSRDLDSSVDHEEASRRGRGPAADSCAWKNASTPPHVAAMCVAAKKPQEKRPRMSM